MKIMYFLLPSLLMLLACESRTDEPVAEKPVEEEPEMMCPMNYDPVCAKIEVDGKTVMKTFSNDCVMGNFKGKIISSAKGACEE